MEVRKMKKCLLILAALAAALTAGACGNTEGDRAVGGALMGGAAGAIIGGAATGRASGALAGGAIGAASGAVVGAATTPRQCVRYGYDYYGNYVCIQYY
jgi:osmotically inducible lipoprotein OsmB